MPSHLATSPFDISIYNQISWWLLRSDRTNPKILNYRAGNGTRTRDLLLGKEVFYQLNYARKPATLQAENAESQNRTGDTMIFSHVLYQLSYLGLKSQCSFQKPHYFTHM